MANSTAYSPVDPYDLLQILQGQPNSPFTTALQQALAPSPPKLPKIEDTYNPEGQKKLQDALSGIRTRSPLIKAGGVAGKGVVDIANLLGGGLNWLGTGKFPTKGITNPFSGGGGGDPSSPTSAPGPWDYTQYFSGDPNMMKQALDWHLNVLKDLKQSDLTNPTKIATVLQNEGFTPKYKAGAAGNLDARLLATQALEPSIDRSLASADSTANMYLDQLTKLAGGNPVLQNALGAEKASISQQEAAMGNQARMAPALQAVQQALANVYRSTGGQQPFTSATGTPTNLLGLPGIKQIK